MTRAALRAGALGMLSFALVATAPAQSPGPGPTSTAASAPAGALVTTSTVTVSTVAAAPHAVGDGEPVTPWTLATLPDDPVAFHGLVNMDNAGLGSGTMLYPMAGLGLVGLLVGVATHAAIVGGSRSSQESAMQRSADKVIEPYQDSLARFHALELERRALALAPAAAMAHLRDARDAPAGEPFVLAVPEFAMTADSAALVLDETIVLRPSAASDKGIQQVVRVISPPRVEDNPRDAWSADDGAALKATAAALMAESLDVALRQSRHPGDDKAAFRTLRYRFGDSERMERAQLLEETCDRLVMRTLRGALLVVPHKAGAVLPAGCPQAPVVAERRPAALPAAAPASAASGVAAAS